MGRGVVARLEAPADAGEKRAPGTYLESAAPRFLRGSMPARPSYRLPGATCATAGQDRAHPERQPPPHPVGSAAPGRPGSWPRGRDSSVPGATHAPSVMPESLRTAGRSEKSSRSRQKLRHGSGSASWGRVAARGAPLRWLGREPWRPWRGPLRGAPGWATRPGLRDKGGAQPRRPRAPGEPCTGRPHQARRGLLPPDPVLARENWFPRLRAARPAGTRPLVHEEPAPRRARSGGPC